MAGKDGIEVEGRIVEVAAGRLFRVELANGHRLLGHVPDSQRRAAEAMAVGDKVRLRLSPYDLSTGRIIEKEK
jgi:translation initiation factor IF-1